MTMSTLFSIVSVILGFGLAMTATSLLATALFPGWTERARQRAGRTPIRTFFVGLSLGGVLVLVGITIAQSGGPGGFFGAIVLSGIFGVTLVGNAGVMHQIGSGLPSPVDDTRPWKAIIRGWVVVFLASLTPVFGWFIVLPVALCMGFGAAVLGLFRRPPRGAGLSAIEDSEGLTEGEPIESAQEKAVATGLRAE
jgi:hypothetical protein